MRVILVDAPNPRHHGHKIRAVESRPPDWYMRHCYSKKGRKTFKRKKFIDALDNIAKGKHQVRVYERIALEAIALERRDPEAFYF